MKHALFGLLVWGLFGNFPEKAAGQAGTGPKEPSQKFQASVHQIHEPGVGTPWEDEVFQAVQVGGFLQAAKEEAMDDVRFQARSKGLKYEICGIEEEKMQFGYRVKILYCLRPLEVATPETFWWQELLKKIELYLPYFRKALAEARQFVYSSFSERQKPEGAGIP